MNRRGFIGAIIGAAAAPAIVRASSLMPIVPRAGYVWTSYGMGFNAVSFSEMVALTLTRHKMDIESSIAQSNALYRHILLTRAFQQE